MLEHYVEQSNADRRNNQIRQKLQQFKDNNEAALNQAINRKLLGDEIDGHGKTWVKNLEKAVKACAEELFQCEFKKVRPEWLRNSSTTRKCRLELDLFNEKLGVNGVAIEINGRQHYKYIPYFHKSIEDFHAQRARDHIKRFILHHRKIILIEVPYNIKRKEITRFLLEKYLEGLQKFRGSV